MRYPIRMGHTLCPTLHHPPSACICTRRNHSLWHCIVVQHTVAFHCVDDRNAKPVARRCGTISSPSQCTWGHKRVRAGRAVRPRDRHALIKMPCPSKIAQAFDNTSAPQLLISFSSSSDFPTFQYSRNLWQCRPLHHNWNWFGYTALDNTGVVFVRD